MHLLIVRFNASYLGSWLKSLRDDKHEIFRATRDAHKAADLLIALEHHKSLEQALAFVNKPQSIDEPQTVSTQINEFPSARMPDQTAMEIEL